jgi:hypothetical protein
LVWPLAALLSLPTNPDAATLPLAAAWLLIDAPPNPADAALVTPADAAPERPALPRPVPPVPKDAPPPTAVCSPTDMPPSGPENPADALFEKPP